METTIERCYPPPPNPACVITDTELQRDLDVQLQNLKALRASPERSIAITKLQECIMWLGMDLKRLIAPDTYPESRNPESPHIEPTADGLRL